MKVLNEMLLKKGEKLDEKYVSEYIKFPCILKPNNGGSSFYTYKIENLEELQEKLNFVFSKIDEDMLIGEFISGDEYSIPLVQGEMIPVMKLAKTDATKIFDYNSKTGDESIMKETFPTIDEASMKSFEKISKKIYDFMGIEGFCRIDFIKRDDEIFCIDINTIPGMTDESITPKAWLETGRSLEEFVREIVRK